VAAAIIQPDYSRISKALVSLLRDKDKKQFRPGSDLSSSDTLAL